MQGNRVYVRTGTVGTGTLTLGAVVSSQFNTFADAGITDGQEIRSYIIEEGTDFEIGRGIYNSAGPTLTRASVRTSRIGNVASTTKMTLAGNATVRVIAAKEDLAQVTQFIIEGDSHSNTSNIGTWPTLLVAQSAFFSRGTSICYAVDGDTAASLVGQYATQGGAAALPGSEQYYFLWAGTPDILVNTAAATIYGYLTTMWAAARASGYKVVAFTLTADGGYNATQNGILRSLNALIVSDTTLYDYVVRLDDLFTNSADTLLYNSDTRHLSAAGNALVAREVAKTVLGVGPVYASPADEFGGGLQANGAMEISQQYGTTATALAVTQTYVMDQFRTDFVGSMALTFQQVADGPPGIPTSLKFAVTTAQASLGAGDYAFIVQPIEGYRAARLAFGGNAGQPLSVGFWIKCHRTGTYSGAICNGAGNRTYPFSFTVNAADAWELKSVTIPPDITGTWPTGSASGLLLVLAIACGTTFAGTANAWAAGLYFGATGTTNGVAATSDTYQITGVYCRPGIYLPPSQRWSRIFRPYDQELKLCKRYFEKSYDYATAPAALSGVGQNFMAVIIPGLVPTTPATLAGFVNFQEPKCAVPAIAAYSPATGASAKVRDQTNSADVTFNLSIASEKGFSWFATQSAANGNINLVFQWTATSRL